MHVTSDGEFICPTGAATGKMTPAPPRFPLLLLCIQNPQCLVDAQKKRKVEWFKKAIPLSPLPFL